MRDIRSKTQPEPRMDAVTLVTAFSGIGGVETGGVMSGRVKPIAGFELDPKKPVLSERFKEVQEQNFDGHTLHNMTIQEAAKENFSMIDPDSTHWYHGSPVCSNFSVANSHSKGETHVDISNVTAFAKGIECLNPRVVTCEQVPAFKASEGAKILYKSLQAAGYDYHWQVVNMADYGIAQDRIRYFLLAWKDGDRPWLFPRHCRSVGWYEATGDLPFAPLPQKKVLHGQEVAIEVHLSRNSDDTFLIERKSYWGEFKIRTQYQPAPTVTRMMFTDKKPGDHNHLVSRHNFMDAVLQGHFVTLSLDHIRRICGFPDWFQSPSIPAITGVGYGYAVTPEFIRLLAECNLS